MDGGKRCENANVDVNTFMRFQETENGGFRKRISVDGALVGRIYRKKACGLGKAKKKKTKNKASGFRDKLLENPRRALNHL